MKKIKLLALIAVGLLSLNACKKEDLNNGTFELNADAVATWKGSKLDGANNGTIKVQSDNIQMVNGNITGGDITIPVSSIINLNIEDNDLRNQLVEHLKSSDFFNMVLHPQITYKIESATLTQGNNYQVKGKLTMLGQTHQLDFPATITRNGKSFTLKANLLVDRLTWGMTHYSDPTGGLYILPNFEIGLDISATKK